MSDEIHAQGVNEPVPEESAAVPETQPAPILRGDRGIEAAQVGVSAFLIVVAGFLSYLGTWNIPFHGEEQQLFLDTPALHRIVTFPDAFEVFPGAPLVVFGYALNWAVAPGSTAALHAVNLLLHLLNGVLLYLVCRNLLGKAVPEPVSMLAGLLLVVHPLSAESVNYLVARPGLQAACFVLLGVLLFQSALEHGEEPGYGRLAAAMVCYALAFGSHAAALALPIVFLGMDAVRHGREGIRRHGGVHAAFFGALVLMAAVRSAAGFAKDVTFPSGIYETLAVQSSFLYRFGDAVVRLPGVRMLYPVSAGISLSIPCFLALLLLILAAIVLLSRRSPAGLALLWAAAMVTATVCLVPLEKVFADRQYYLPLVGAVLLPSWGIGLLKRPQLRLAGGTLGAVAVLACVFVTYQNNRLWEAPVELWADAADRVSASAEPWRYLGRYMVRQAETLAEPEQREMALRQAEQPWRRAHEILPEDPETLSNLGILLHKIKKPEEALPLLQEALRRNPFDQAATLHVALLLEAQLQAGGDRDSLRRAIDYFERAEQLGPLPPEGVSGYAMALIGTGRIEAAIPRLRQIAGNKEDATIAALQKQFEAMAGQLQALDAKAEQQFGENSTGLDGFSTTAEADLLRGKFLQAAYLLNVILKRDPENVQAWPLLGYARAAMDDTAGFLAEWGAARADNPDAWKTLAARCAMGGEWDAALAYLSSETAGGGAVSPHMRLAEIALELRQGRRAFALLQQAAQVRPDDPAPWLRMCDLAISGKDQVRARQFLAEAEKRNASAEEIEKRRQAVGATPEEALQPLRTIIR